MERQSQGGMWMRGDTIARGSFGTVSLATAKQKANKRRNHLPPLMAVKWAEVSRSGTLQKEREILTRLEGCPHILRCYGDEITRENGELTYNVLLEYASGGNLASRIKNSHGGLPEADVRRYTRSILQGLHHIHDHGYVHCDIKPQNILLVLCSSSSSSDTSHDDCVAKIADFGSAKNTMREQRKRKKERHSLSLRGTPLYMSPESVARKEQEAPSDIWALGCLVAEMISGKPAWNCESDMDVDELLSLIGSSREWPETPSKMSKEGKDFLKRCFVRTSMFRWTAAMLLHHPFVSENVQVQTAPEFPNDTKVQLSVSIVEESAVGGQKRRRINDSDEPSIGDDSLKPVSKDSISLRVGTNFMAEIGAFFVGVKQAQELNIDKLWIESDRQQWYHPFFLARFHGASCRHGGRSLLSLTPYSGEPPTVTGKRMRLQMR
ncbi:mitogen-activated protein kinase kinase kinase 20-like [Telopea speciosissima]|uniref:mitogen-activated protein kinase kinase kinase 20-like n=1 Tax=Telopea speciosissima TaxID=54955 RepID=UPI001CC759F5|nr:mitogen-activated protein kinase kinase kinase 20-like [Telopea speciosissima]